MAKILLVEDDEISSLVISTVLGSEGYEVAKAANYEEAIDAAAASTPELLISDWRLDGQRTGHDIAIELSRLHNKLRIVFISGFEPEEIRKAATGLNVVAVLGKPCDFDEVLAIVQKTLPL